MSKKSDKLKATLKIDITIVPLFFQMSDLLVPKIEICLKYFLDKKLPKAAIVICMKSNQILSSSKCIEQKFDIAYLFLFSSLEKESLTLEHYLQENAISTSHALLVTFKL